MKKKSEVPAYLRLYAAMLLNETGNYILTLRSDNGRAEYINNENKGQSKKKGVNYMRTNNEFNTLLSLLSLVREMWNPS